MDKDSDSWIALHWAARKGYLEIAQILLAAGSDVNAKDRDGWTPLHVVAMTEGLVEADKIAEILLQAGADVNLETNNKMTALDYAERRGQAKLIKIFQAAGADE